MEKKDLEQTGSLLINHLMFNYVQHKFLLHAGGVLFYFVFLNAQISGSLNPHCEKKQNKTNDGENLGRAGARLVSAEALSCGSALLCLGATAKPRPFPFKRIIPERTRYKKRVR